MPHVIHPISIPLALQLDKHSSTFQGAHHLDLKSPNPADPEDVTATRQKEEEILSNWIQEWAIENP
jgi:hypothetical protein